MLILQTVEGSRVHLLHQGHRRHGIFHFWLASVKLEFIYNHVVSGQDVREQKRGNARGRNVRPLLAT